MALKGTADGAERRAKAGRPAPKPSSGPLPLFGQVVGAALSSNPIGLAARTFFDKGFRDNAVAPVMRTAGATPGYAIAKGLSAGGWIDHSQADLDARFASLWNNGGSGSPDLRNQANAQSAASNLPGLGVSPAAAGAVANGITPFVSDPRMPSPSDFYVENPFARDASQTVNYWREQLAATDADYQRQRAEINARYKFAETDAEKNRFRKQMSALMKKSKDATNNLQNAYDYSTGRIANVSQQQSDYYSTAATKGAQDMALAQSSFMGATTGDRLSPAAQASLAAGAGQATALAGELNGNAANTMNFGANSINSLEVARQMATGRMGRDADALDADLRARHADSLAQREASMMSQRNSSLDSLLADQRNSRLSIAREIAGGDQWAQQFKADSYQDAIEKSLLARGEMEAAGAAGGGQARTSAFDIPAPSLDLPAMPNMLDPKVAEDTNIFSTIASSPYGYLGTPGDITTATYLTPEDVDAVWEIASTAWELADQNKDPKAKRTDFSSSLLDRLKTPAQRKARAAMEAQLGMSLWQYIETYGAE